RALHSFPTRRSSDLIGLRFPVEVGLCGHARSTLQVLLPHIRRRQDRSFLEAAQTGMKAWRDLMHTRTHRDDVPMKPQVVAHALRSEEHTSELQSLAY